MSVRDFRTCMASHPVVLMEGALSERLKREYRFVLDPHVTMAKLYQNHLEAQALRQLWTGYAEIARQYGFPFLAATPTRRTNRETIEKAGCTDQVIDGCTALLRSVQQQSGIDMYVGGQIGNRGNAYSTEGALTEAEAFDFHRWTVERFVRAEADYLYLSLIPTLPEASGLARAADESGLPYLVSFTIQQDGRLLDGTSIADAISYIDSITVRQPVLYMSNCVHPRFVYRALTQPFNQTGQVKKRFAGIQANAAPMTFAELDASPVLHTSAPQELADEMMKLAELDQIRIWGGCCGTDDRHMACIAKALRERFPDA